MAKELPYFKFEPGSWENGRIQMCSFESKGLFIEICSMYWARLGELPYALALQKLCRGDNSALHELLNHEILCVIDEQIVIEFLDEQLNEFQETSSKRRDAANKRWNNASALQKQSKSNAIREEKKREEKRREEKRGVIFPFDSVEFLKTWEMWKDYKKKDHKFGYKSSTSEQAALKKLNEMAGGAEPLAIKIIMQSIENGWKGFFELKQNNGSRQRLTDEQSHYIASRTDI